MKIVLGIADGNIKIWEFIENDIMINHIMFSKRRIEIPSERSFSIWVDSGGYQIMIKGENIGIEEVATRYKSIDAEYYMSLDIPISDPSMATPKLVEININNYLKLTKLIPEKKIIPVVHLYPSKLLIQAVEEYISLGNDIIAYGGIVPPLLRKTRLRLKSLIGFLILKKAFPGVKFHVLGIGSYLMIRIMEALGAYSIDTSSWRVKAAFGHIIIPGLGERHVSNRNIKFRTPKAKKDELDTLYDALKKTGFPYIDEFYLLLKKFHGRALINAWVITKVNNGISKKSSFLSLYNKLMGYKEMSLEELMKIYDGS